MADPRNSRRVAPLALDCYLAIGYIPVIFAFWMIVSCRLRILEFDLQSAGRLSTERYWAPPVFDPHPGVSEVELQEEFEEILEKAVRRQMIADVPVGVLLSGGVDSSLVLQWRLAKAQNSKPLRPDFWAAQEWTRPSTPA